MNMLDVMKGSFSCGKDMVLNYQALKQLKRENKQVAFQDIRFLDMNMIMKYHHELRNFYMIYQTFQELDEKQKEWVLTSLFQEENLMMLHPRTINVFFEKIWMCQEKYEVVVKNKECLRQLEEGLSFRLYGTILHNIRSGKIVEEDIEKLSSAKILSFLQEQEDASVLELLAMPDENRNIYIDEFDSTLQPITEKEYPSFWNMKPANFKRVLTFIKNHYDNEENNVVCIDKFCSFSELLAQEYGNADEKVIDFILEAFPYSDALLDSGKLPDTFRQLVDAIVTVKDEKELSLLKEKYASFLNNSFMHLRYETILDERFIKSVNKEELLELLDSDDRILYQNRRTDLLDSGIYEAEKIDAATTQFIKEAENPFMMKERTRLVLTPNFSTIASKDIILSRMENIGCIDDAKKICDVTQIICSQELSLEEQEKLLNNMPGKEHRIEYQDYSISFTGLDDYFESITGDNQVEFYKGPLKLIIRKDNACKK